MRDGFLSLLLAMVSDGLMLRDRLLGVTRRLARSGAQEEFFFASGGRRLASVFVPGLGLGLGPYLLICHGIGETVEHWSAVQEWFGARGVGSMVFNYSGYGRSSGRVCVKNCDDDLAAAYKELRRRVGDEARVYVLGFSLGSGIAAKGAGALVPPVEGVFLCESFTSFREAACAAGVPRWLTKTVPDVWKTVANVGQLAMPVCVVHSDSDRLFPLEMPRKIVEACGARGELVVVPGLEHNEPYLKPTEAYWGPVLERILRASPPCD